MSAPVRLRAGSPAHRALQGTGWVLLLVVVAAIPAVCSESNVRLFSQAAAFSVAVLGLNLVSGWSGQLSLGHGAFMGVGAYTTAVLVADHSWSYFTTVPVAAALCFAVGVLVGIPALRLKGLYLALATVGLAVIFPNLVDKLESITGGSNGKNIPVRRIRLNAPGWTGLQAREDGYIWVYMVIVGVTALLYLLARNMVASRSGRALIALRDNPIGAEVSGVDIARHKVLAFGISAAYAGIAGSLYMFTVSNASGSAYSVNLSIELLTGVVIGGLASLPGSMLGGLLVTFLPEWAGDWGDGTLAGAVYGVMLLAILALHPSGVAGLVRRMRDALVVVVPGPPRAGDPDAVKLELNLLIGNKKSGVRSSRPEGGKRHGDQGEANVMAQRKVRIAAVLAALGLFVAACGDDGGETGEATPGDRTGTTASGATGAATGAGSGSPAASTTAAPADPLAALGVDVKRDCPSDYKPDQGVTASEILVGQSVPKTGSAASFSLLTDGMQAYFDYANAELNGVNGKKLKLVALDDGYEPDRTVKNVQDLLSQGVFVTSGILGTPNNLAVRDTLNDRCVPQLYPSTGSPDWGDVDNYPWTVSGAVVPYNVEARIWVEQLKKQFPNGANVVALEASNAFGGDYETWFKKYIEGTNLKLTKVEKHDPNSPDVTNQITTLAATKADAVIHMTTGAACTSAMKAVGASGWKPLQLVSGTCKTSVYFAPAGDGAKDAQIVTLGKEITYPEYDADPAVKALRDQLTKYAKDKPIQISLVPTGWVYGEILRDTMLRAEKLPGGLTRPNMLVAARSTDFKSAYFYDGSSLKLTGKTDAFLIEAARVEKWNGTAFEKVGDLFNYEGTTKYK